MKHQIIFNKNQITKIATELSKVEYSENLGNLLNQVSQAYFQGKQQTNRISKFANSHGEVRKKEGLDYIKFTVHQ